mmetsp:Transcript_25678/g.44975  ORF Transcript_25678/g.44975 Transcript_25678/m.44975 type:complete len:368 (-) Transcript_25678:1641-2744(-)
MNSVIGTRVKALSDSPNYPAVFKAFIKHPIVAVAPSGEKNVQFLLENGTALLFDGTRILKLETKWRQYVTSGIEIALFSDCLPMCFYLKTELLVLIYFDEKTGRELTCATERMNFRPTSLKFNGSRRIIVASSSSNIQVLVLSKSNELLSFSPFAPVTPLIDLIDNSVLFSLKFGNLFYYLDQCADPALQTIILHERAAFNYTIVKCIIDNREISESKAFQIKVESELISLDINLEEAFVFLSKEKFLHLYKGKSVKSLHIQVEDALTKVRWDKSGKFVYVVSSTNKVFILDYCLQLFRVIKSDNIAYYTDLGCDSLFRPVTTVIASTFFCVLASSKNFSILSLMNHPVQQLSPILVHLKALNFTAV